LALNSSAHTSQPTASAGHNTALKWFCDHLEKQNKTELTFDNDGPVSIDRMVHPKGPQYYFVNDKTTSWRWQDMVFDLQPQSRNFIVQRQVDATI